VIAVEAVREVTIRGNKVEVTERGERVYYKEISDRKNKAHFSISKNKEANKKAEYGLTAFWTEVFS
jgi:HSP20 family molecular chaperone IbpA